jgi:hypothetical protein
MQVPAVKRYQKIEACHSPCVVVCAMVCKSRISRQGFAGLPLFFKNPVPKDFLNE